MLTDRLRDRVRIWLGTDQIASLHRRLDALEATMSEITDALNRLAQQVNGVSAAQATSFHNLHVALEGLKAGNLTDEQRALVTQIETSLTKLGEDAAAGDNGFEPTPAPVEETPQVPVDNTPTVPVENVPVEETPAEGSTRRGR